MRRSILIVVLVTIACYAHIAFSSRTEFVCDDRRFVERNEAVHNLSNAPRFLIDPTLVDPDGWPGIYRPLRSADFAVDWAIAGGSPPFFHVRNVLYHILAAVLVLLLLRRWGAGGSGALLGALVFAAHPVQVEAVAWITSRGDLLCLLFFLAALLVHQGSNGFDRRLAGAGGLLALALLSKETAVMFPAAALLSDFFFRDERLLKRTSRRWPQYVTYLVLAGLYMGTWTWLHVANDALLRHTLRPWGGSFAGTLLTMSRGFVYYARVLLLPVDMAMDFNIRPVRTPDPLTVVCALLASAAIAVAVWRAFRCGGPVAFGILWALVTIFPASNLPAPIGIPTAERFLYLPMAGLALPAGCLLARTFSKGRLGRVATVALLLCLCAVTFARTFDWESDRALWSSSLRRFESPRALGFRAEDRRQRASELRSEAALLREQGETAEALRLEVRTLDLLEGALRDFNREMDLWRELPIWGPPYTVVRAGRALAYVELGWLDEALEDAKALLDHPVRSFLGRAHLVRALVFHARGQLRAAAREADLALESENSEMFREKGAAIYQDLATWYNEPGRDNRARTILSLRRSWALLPEPERNRGVREALDATEQEYADLAAPLRQRIALGQVDPMARLQLAVINARFANYEEAAPLFDSLLAPALAGCDPGVLFLYARYFWENRDTPEGYDRARMIYQEIASVAPGFRGVRGALERVTLARELLEESLQLPRQ